jgi:hypothetical protein
MARRLVAGALACASLLLCGCGTSTGQLLFTSNGSGPHQSAVFDPGGPWQVDYRWDCTSAALRTRALQPGFGWDTLNADDSTLTADNPHQHAKGMKGSGTARYPMSGAYQLDITSPCDWVVQVKVQK